MNRNQLRELHNREEEKIHKLRLDFFVRTSERAKPAFMDSMEQAENYFEGKQDTFRPWHAVDSASILDMFPEFEMRTPYTGYIPGVPLLAQLPFYEKLIVSPIPVLPTEKDFVNVFGLSVRQLLALMKKGKVFVAVDDYESYSDLDYLDPILETRPPDSVTRYFVFMEMLMLLRGNSPSDYYENAKYAGTELYRSPMMKRSSDYSKLRTELKQRPTKRLLTNAYGIPYASLTACGYEGLASRLLRKHSFESLQAMREYLRFLVVGPQFECLDGIVSLTKEDVAQGLPPEVKWIPEVFPVDVGKLLVQNLPLVFIKNIGFDETIEVSSSSADAAKLLFEIDNLASQGRFKELPRADAIQLAFREAQEAAHSMAKQKKLIELGAKVSIGVLGAGLGALLGGYPGLLAGSFGATYTILPTAEQIAESAVRWRKPHHAVTFYDLKSQLTDHRSPL